MSKISETCTNIRRTSYKQNEISIYVFAVFKMCKQDDNIISIIFCLLDVFVPHVFIVRMVPL